MFSIRRHSLRHAADAQGKWTLALMLSAVIGLAAITGGCERIPKGTPGPINPTPIALDDAMLIRDWPPLTSSYANGAVQAWPLGFVWQPPYNEPEWIAPVWEPAQFVTQSALFPVTYVAQGGPSKQVVYHGVQVPPTYTASPPLPPLPPPAIVVITVPAKVAPTSVQSTTRPAPVQQ